VFLRGAWHGREYDGRVIRAPALLDIMDAIVQAELNLAIQ